MAGSTQEEVATTQQSVAVTIIVISFSNSGRSSYHVHNGQQGCRGRDAPIALVEYNEFHKQIVDKIAPTSKFVLFLKEFRSFNIARGFYATFRTCFSTLIYSNVMYRNNM
jgi:hypothetical protein